jgi:hypothetical protein
MYAEAAQTVGKSIDPFPIDGVGETVISADNTCFSPMKFQSSFQESYRGEWDIHFISLLVTCLNRFRKLTAGQTHCAEGLYAVKASIVTTRGDFVKKKIIMPSSPKSGNSILDEAEAKGKFRRLTLLDDVGWDTLVWKMKKTPRFMIEED